VPAHIGLVARRRRMTIGCIAAALLLHAAIGWMLMRAAAPLPPRVGAQSAVVTVRWLHVSAPPPLPAQATPQRALPRSEPARPRLARTARPARAVAAAPAVPPAAATVATDGHAFGLPRIAYGGVAAAAGMRAFAPAAAARPPSGAHDALRRQIADHIQRHLAALPAPPADGRCALSGASEPQLLCDSDPLNAALAEHAVPLARLISAHQRSLSGAEPAVIEAQAGQFRLALP
jgi:hypothetical protein